MTRTEYLKAIASYKAKDWAQLDYPEFKTQSANFKFVAELVPVDLISEVTPDIFEILETIEAVELSKNW